MKPIWKQPYRNKFLERAGLYLLYAFILSIAANPFIVLFLAGRDHLNYVVVEPKFEGLQPTYTPQQQELLTKYKQATPEFITEQHEFETRISWIIITALLGWISTSPRFQRGWPKLITKLQTSKYFNHENETIK